MSGSAASRRPDRLTPRFPLRAHRELEERARRAFPDGIYGHVNARDLPPGYPQYFARGDGAWLWDVDGNPYLDLMCSWGPILLGHHEPHVAAAARAQAERGDCLNGPGPEFVELAERFTSMIPYASWTVFCKNGTDATTLAVRIARAASGRERVLAARGAYHGVAPWCVPGGVGTTVGERETIEGFDFNDLESVERAVTGLESDIAAIVVCPIRHDLRHDLQLPDSGFARGLRELCDQIGAALILDEVRCGLRLGASGSWDHLGVEPDLSAWSKAIANGYPLACVLGSDAFRDAAARTYTTGSFWFAGVPVAAALATLEVVADTDALAIMQRSGERLKDGLAAMAEREGLSVMLSGPPQMPFMTFDEDTPEMALSMHWASECVRRGLYLHPTHNWFLSAAHGDAEIDQAIAVAAEAFAATAQARAAGTIKD